MDAREPEYDAEAFIVDEDQVVLLTQQGWVKRQGRVTDVTATRTRDGDAVMDVTAGSTRHSVAFFSSLGSCYVARIVDIPATTGYGNPVQSLFKLADGERIVRMLGFDPRVLDVPEPTEGAEEPEAPHAIAVSAGGMTTRFSLRSHRDPSTRSGRRFMRLGKNDEVVMVDLSYDDDKVAAASEKGHVLLTTHDEITVLSGAGKGVKLMKLAPGDRVIAARVLVDMSTVMTLEKEGSSTSFEITIRRTITGRGGKGQALFKRGRLSREVPPIPVVPELSEEE